MMAEEKEFVDHCLPEFVAPIRDEKTQLAAFHESYIKQTEKQTAAEKGTDLFY